MRAGDRVDQLPGNANPVTGLGSGDPEQEYFADGMVEEIITAIGQ